MRINYINIPESYAAEVKNLISKYSFLCPSWVNDVDVCVSKENIENYTLDIKTSQPYRVCTIVFYPRFFATENQHDKDKSVIHEFCHNFYAPLRALAHDLLDAAKLTDEGSVELFRKVISDIDEGITQDLAELVMNKLSHTTDVQILQNLHDKVVA